MSVDVEALRCDLEANNGMPGLEILRPDEVDAAVRIFYRDGFVVVRDVLTADQVRFLRQGCEREAAEVVALDPSRDGNRHGNRYSWGGASLTNSVLHREEWVMLVDLPISQPCGTRGAGRSSAYFGVTGSTFRANNHTDNRAKGTKSAPMTKAGTQFGSVCGPVTQGIKEFMIKTPTTAAVPPTPASEPTESPE